MDDFCDLHERGKLAQLGDIAVITSPTRTLPVLSIPPECPTLVESLDTTSSEIMLAISNCWNKLLRLNS
ncbi:hypothetical protein CMV_015370 [Castanea mollissima]|uniref:Uncharacterized protein n=1 Tax=Castanea mollissima TaxID=60419 RepID=A0A8J4VSV3_9ROSI|nr:hypothetical protein CMV_015370 [Castanea mollissima]